MKNLGTMIGISLIFFLSVSCSHVRRTPAADATDIQKWTSSSVTYVLEDIISTSTGKSIYGIGGESATLSKRCTIDLMKRNLVEGRLEIVQYSDETPNRSYRTLSIPAVHAKMDFGNMIFSCNKFRKNSSWSFTVVADKTIGDIFSGVYRVETLNISGDATVPIGLNQAYVVNERKIMIMNLQNMHPTLTVGDGVVFTVNSVEFDLAEVDLKEKSVTVTIDRNDGTTTTERKLSYKDVRDIVL